MNGQHMQYLSALMTIGAVLMTGSTATHASDTGTSTPHPDERHIVFLDDKAWLNDVGVLLYADPDIDGYFSGISISIDADSSYTNYEVYAVFDIIDELDRPERLYQTQSFDVFGQSISDEYRVDIDLVQNYSPGIYNLQIDLVDAHDDRLLDRVTAADFRNLSALPLESEDNETVDIPVVDRPEQAPNDDIRVVEYAGGTGTAMLLLILSSLCLRLRSMRPENAVV